LALEPFNQNAAVHMGLRSAGDFEELARGGFGVGIGARLNELIHQAFLAYAAEMGKRRSWLSAGLWPSKMAPQS